MASFLSLPVFPLFQLSQRKVILMITPQRMISQGDQTREAGRNEHEEGVSTVLDDVRSGASDPTTTRDESKQNPAETIRQAKSAHRPVTYPAWPTSKPGPPIVLPPPGQHPHAIRTDQMVYECYDQEQGIECVGPSRSVLFPPHRGKKNIPADRSPDMLAEDEATARWLDDGGATGKENTVIAEEMEPSIVVGPAGGV
jgi:hypothetical protein